MPSFLSLLSISYLIEIQDLAFVYNQMMLQTCNHLSVVKSIVSFFLKDLEDSLVSESSFGTKRLGVSLKEIWK